MTYDFKVKSLTLKANTLTPQTIPLESKKIIVFVGPNNAGKSTALKEIRRAALAEDGYYLPVDNHGTTGNTNVVFSEINFSEPESATEVISALELENKIIKHPDGFWKNTDCCDSRLSIDPNGSYYYQHPSINQLPLSRDWREHLELFIPLDTVDENEPHDHRTDYYSFIGPSLVNYMGAEERLLFSIGSRYRGSLDHESNFLSSTMGNEELYESLSEETYEQFGGRVYPDILSHGGIVSLRASRQEKRTIDDPFLNSEGDGFRSFVATYLVLKCGKRPLLLLDEPEAFLHPPQAKRLAQIIGEVANEESSQIFIATHSRDILEGIISSCPNGVEIIRMQRTQKGQSLSIVEASAISNLASSSLHFSNIIDALFSKTAPLLEGKDDAAFVDALADTLHLPERPLCVGVMGKPNFAKASRFLPRRNVFGDA